jgi:DNA polymerase-3 subunit alpha
MSTDYDKFLRFKVYHRSETEGFPMTDVHKERIEFELGVIKQMTYAGYFLIISDLCDFMRSRGILYIARGSGCGSTVIWRLGVSHQWLDPVEYGIPFERFLNPSRVSMPDIDIDIDDTRRDEVVEYTIQKYGAERVAKIVTFGTLAAKMAINDMCRALNLPEYQKVAASITQFIPAGKTTIKDALKDSEGLRDMQAKYPDVFEYAKRVEGKIRNSSIHAAGTIITPGPMTDYMPVAYWGDPAARTPAENFPTCQFDMYDAEERGHLKMDYLGLKTLRVIAQTTKAINTIRKLKGLPQDFDINKIDRRDQATFDMLAEGKTSCVFQIEKQFVRNFAKRMGLKRCDPWQLAVLVSIIRPGMMDTGMTEEYLKRANGDSPVTYPHPKLEEVLKGNFGILVFQEDCMWVARALAGFNLSEADDLRRGISKKKMKDMMRIKPEFIKGAIKEGVTEAEANEVWELIVTFGRYGFNNAHAAAYGMVISYWTAFLKRHHPLPFMMNMINSEAGSTSKEDGYNFKVCEYIEEARSMGLLIHPPCVKKSYPVCSIDLRDNSIRFGLSLIKKVSNKGVDWLMKHGRTADSFKDFILSGYEIRPNTKDIPAPYVKVGKGDLEGLILSGAMDCFEKGNRAKMIAMLPKVMDLCESYWEQLGKEQAGKKVRVKSADVKLALDTYNLEDDQYPEVTLEARLEAEREVTGCFLSESPFQPYRGTIFAHCNCNPDDLLSGAFTSNSAVFAGILTKISPTVIKSGKNKGANMGFLGFTGTNGSSLECVVFSKEWERVNGKKGGLEKGKVYVAGVRRDERGSGFILNDATRLSNCGFDA